MARGIGGMSYKQTGLFDMPPVFRNVRPAHVVGSDTSRAAAESIESLTGEMHRQVYDQINDHPSTDDELEVALKLRHQTVTARRRELVLRGLVRDSGKRRVTRSGRKATVWEVGL